MHSSITLHVHVIFVPAQNMKQSLLSLQNTQTHVHILTVEKRKLKAVLALSEGQTSQVLSAD